MELCVRGSCLEVRMMQWLWAWLCFSYSCAFTHLAVFISTYGISLAHPVLQLPSLGIVLLLLSPGVRSHQRPRGRMSANMACLQIKRCCCLCFNGNRWLLNWIVVLVPKLTENMMMSSCHNSLISPSLCLAPASCVRLKLQQEDILVILNLTLFASRHLKSNYLRTEIPSHQLIQCKVWPHPNLVNQ